MVFLWRQVAAMPLGDIFLLLSVATLGLLAGRIMRLPAIVAYLAAGVVVGPGGFGWIDRTPEIEGVAELGVALLLFGVGIELSLERLRRILVRMIVSGTLQVVLTIIATAVILRGLGIAWPRGVFAGFLVALSSTAVVLKLYGDAGEVDAPHGQAATGILLFQDLALVPLILLTPILASPPENALFATSVALGKAAVALSVILVLTRTVLPGLLQMVARLRTPELFSLVSLVCAFGTAGLASAAGLSLPIGAFLAGLALSGSPYAHQVFAEVVPLRDAFGALFFTNIGLLFDPALVLADPGPVAGLVAAVIVVKAALVVVVTGVLWRSWRVGLLTGFGLAQVGEFSFVLSREGIHAGIIGEPFEQAFLGAAILTMGMAPLLHRMGRSVASFKGDGKTDEAAGARAAAAGHVVIVGAGTTGRAVARVLREVGIAHRAVDLNPRNVRAGRREGLSIVFGEGTRRGMLESLGAASARAAVVALSDPLATRVAVSMLRQVNPDIHVLVRARYVAEVEELERLGASEVIPAEFESSIEIFVRLLSHYGVPRHIVRLQESLVRMGHYRALRGFGLAPELLPAFRDVLTGAIVETARVQEGSAADGRSLAELDLRRRTGTTVLSLVRDDTPQANPGGQTRLRVGDVVVLFGSHRGIDQSIRLFERPEPG